MNNKIFVIIIMLFITACSTLTKSVDIPIPLACPAPHIPAKPQLLTANLRGNETPNVVQKAEVADIKALTAYSDQLIAILKGYQQ